MTRSIGQTAGQALGRTELERLVPLVSRGDATRRLTTSLLRRRPKALRLIDLPLFRVQGQFGKQAVEFGVCGLSGEVRRLDVSVDLYSRERRDNEFFEPILSAEDAETRARDEIPWIVLPIALKGGGNAELDALKSIELLAYPYWLALRERRGIFSARLLDALSGSVVGPKRGASVVEAMVRADAKDERPEHSS